MSEQGSGQQDIPKSTYDPTDPFGKRQRAEMRAERARGVSGVRNSSQQIPAQQRFTQRQLPQPRQVCRKHGNRAHHESLVEARDLKEERLQGVHNTHSQGQGSLAQSRSFNPLNLTASPYPSPSPSLSETKPALAKMRKTWDFLSAEQLKRVSPATLRKYFLNMTPEQRDTHDTVFQDVMNEVQQMEEAKQKAVEERMKALEKAAEERKKAEKENPELRRLRPGFW